MGYQGKTVLVTGGATGIGRATARAFAAAGANVMIGDMSDSASETVDAIKAAGGKAAWRRCDVAVKEQVDALVAATVKDFGGLHAAFNNAGIFLKQQPLHEIPLETYRRVMAVNADGVFLAMQAEIRHMLEHGGGAIVNTSSVGGVIANMDMSPYIASKHAVVGLTRAAAIEYARKGIRVNAICPGFVATNMTANWLADPNFLNAFLPTSPIGRPAQPEEISGMVLHLCSDEASFTNGSIIIIDGGQTAI
jgi:NAD(P)-dependent dehydrogenase (short-subunit alcohol dehydrogenase family)